MGGGGPPEELHPTALGARVLVGQKGHRASVGQYLNDPVEAAVLRNDVLPGAGAELIHKPIEIGVVERPGDGVRGESQDAQHVAAHLEIAQVRRDDQQGAIAKQVAH